MIEILEYGKTENSKIFARVSPKMDVEKIVADILLNVKTNGDKALKEYTEKFDGAVLDSLQVSKEEIEQALLSVDKEFLRVLKLAKKNITKFHLKQVRKGFKLRQKNGIVIGQKITPIERAGLYVPGGTASYPSTVLMDAIPAKIAGCKQVVMVTPPDKNGKINPVILASAYIAGVDKIFKVGGAQAICALAYGTESIPKVDKIVGPGNAFVAEAKKQVFGLVSIDMIAGPSEIMVVADGKSNAKIVASDLLSQAEHDKMASAVLVTNSIQLAKAVSEELEKQIPLLPRKDIARASIDDNGKIIIVENLDIAIKVANEIAPEHLELLVDKPFDYLERIGNAGSVFMGRFCPEALGDYLAGTNHTLPTSGTARFSSPLSVDDFIKKTQFTFYTKKGLQNVYKDVAYFAEKEGLRAHAKSATVRFGDNNE